MSRYLRDYWLGARAYLAGIANFYPELEIEFYSGEPSKLYIKASNGYFSGCTETYINENWLSKMASELKAFPKNIS